MTNWLSPFPWAQFPKKLEKCIQRPTAAGRFLEDESKARKMRLAHGSSGSVDEGNALYLYWLVDPDDGHIVDAKFLAYGETPLIGTAELISQWAVGKNYDQASRLTSSIVEDEAGGPFPKEILPLLNLALDAVEKTAATCTDIPLPIAYSAPPVSFTGDIVEGGIPDWFNLSTAEQIAIVEEVLNKDIRPYIALDGGGVEMLNLLAGKEAIISYQGNCTSCYSSTGATLSYIQQVLRAKVHPDITVTPDL